MLTHPLQPLLHEEIIELEKLFEKTYPHLQYNRVDDILYYYTKKKKEEKHWLGIRSGHTSYSKLWSWFSV